MLKPSFLNVLLFLFVKYMVFYGILMIRNNNYSLLDQDNLAGGHTFVYFLLIMMPYPLVNMILFSAPIYFSLKVKNITHFILLIGGFLIAEYLVYVLFTSVKYADITGVYNAILSLLFLLLFFYKRINLIFKHAAK